MQRVRVEVCAVSFYLNCYYFYALTFVISIVCGFLYAACERVCNNTSLSISFIFHISHCAQASAACVCVCHWPSCAVRFIFVCDTLCGDHINIPKYCNNFALSILFDFPLAVVGLFCIYILKRWYGKHYVSSPMPDYSHALRSFHSFAMVGLSFPLTELRPFCVQSLFPYLKFCLAFRCASFGAPFCPGFTFNKHSFRTFSSYQFRFEKNHYLLTNAL